MIKECIEIKKKEADFSIFATGLNISANAHGLASIVQIKDNHFDTTDGYILRRTKLDGDYKEGCYQKVYRLNSKIFLAQAETYGYPDFDGVLNTEEGYVKIAELTLDTLNAPAQYITLIRLPGPININYKYFSMLRGTFSI